MQEAGFPHGFDAGEITSGPPYHTLAEGIATYLQAGGIRVRVRPMERAAHLTALREKELVGLSSIGPRIAESGLGLIPFYYYTGPYEDLRLRE